MAKRSVYRVSNYDKKYIEEIEVDLNIYNFNKITGIIYIKDEVAFVCK